VFLNLEKLPKQKKENYKYNINNKILLTLLEKKIKNKQFNFKKKIYTKIQIVKFIWL